MNMMTTITAAPTVTIEWTAARDAYLNAKRIEDEFDARFVMPDVDSITPTIDRVSMRLTDARCDAEDALMKVRSPDLAAVALKFEIWFDNGEPRLESWGLIIRDELRQLATDLMQV